MATNYLQGDFYNMQTLSKKYDPTLETNGLIIMMLVKNYFKWKLWIYYLCWTICPHDFSISKPNLVQKLKSYNQCFWARIWFVYLYSSIVYLRQEWAKITFDPNMYPIWNLIFHLKLSSLCCWPKCEHIEGSTDFSFQTQFLQFVWISSNKIHSKINIFHTLVLIFLKQTLLNLTCPGLADNTKIAPKSQYSFSVSIWLSFHWEMTH